jgi:hypothetical protein
MDETVYRIVLIPRLPAGLFVDVVFRTKRGFAIKASDQLVQSLKSQNIPVVELYASAEEYAGEMMNKSKEAAIAAIESLQDQALAALDPAERDQFSVA